MLVVKVGGRQSGRSHGIHWHVDPDHTLRYRSDEKRQTMYEVEMVAKDGTRRTWTSPAAETPEGQKATEWRTMDCVDCHNRPTHIYRSPEQELDAALSDRRVDRSLPFIRREGLAALRATYPSEPLAREGIARAVADFYAKGYPQVATQQAQAVAAAGKALGDIWAWNVFPAMNITWGTYSNHIGHTKDMSNEIGCFRCHDEQHQSRGRPHDLAGLHDLPHAARAGREGPRDPEDAGAVAPQRSVGTNQRSVSTTLGSSG